MISWRPRGRFLFLIQKTNKPHVVVAFVEMKRQLQQSRHLLYVGVLCLAMLNVVQGAGRSVDSTISRPTSETSSEGCASSQEGGVQQTVGWAERIQQAGGLGPGVRSIMEEQLGRSVRDLPQSFPHAQAIPHSVRSKLRGAFSTPPLFPSPPQSQQADQKQNSETGLKETQAAVAEQDITVHDSSTIPDNPENSYGGRDPDTLSAAGLWPPFLTR